MGTRFLLISTVTALGLASNPGFSHHSFAVHDDSSKPVTKEGVVTDFRFTNPHGILMLVVTNGKASRYPAKSGAIRDLGAPSRTGGNFGERDVKEAARAAAMKWNPMDEATVAREKLLKQANVTVIHNGVILHHKKEIGGNTPHHANGSYAMPHAPEVFIELQDHGNPMRFRNIWIRRLGNHDQPTRSTD